jgi:16S rRNA (cytidine1402-2'-O)-methyltransferase
MLGTLYVVSTPIGNLEDVTFRALRVLREADLIAAEDTRHTARLLQRYDIHTPTTSVHEHNERQKLPALIARLSAGEKIAVVSDAGTPGVRDPGYRLVRAAVEAGIPVEAVPGASAVLAALVASGLPTDTFVFLGFPPVKGRARAEWFSTLSSEPRTAVFFEAPHRIRGTLETLAGHVKDREVVIGRELTKVHEEMLRGTAAALLERLGDPRGEMTVVVAGASNDAEPEPPTDAVLWQTYRDMASATGMTRRDVISAVAARYRLPLKTVYAAIERQKSLTDSR